MLLISVLEVFSLSSETRNMTSFKRPNRFRKRKSTDTRPFNRVSSMKSHETLLFRLAARFPRVLSASISATDCYGTIFPSLTAALSMVVRCENS